MEFPDLGEHCSESTCKQLDFLPMKCDACNAIFCRDHLFYDSHNCPSVYKKDIQVPVCPLCAQPIPVPRGQPPDILVGQHIDRDCKSDPAQKRRKVYSNRCSVQGCKVKEMIPVSCPSCHNNFCLKHRHESDHSCQGPSAGSSAKNVAHSNAISKKTPVQVNARKSRPAQVNASAFQGSMSEDEALARALQDSMINGNASAPQQQAMSQEQQDFLLAQAIAASEQQQPTSNRRMRMPDTCCQS